jgi:predicted nucleic acid-binding protein
MSVFCNQNGTKLSVVDCSIVAMARHYHVEHVVTFDRGFSKMSGIVVLDK